jgi:hypothetical protein
MKRLLSKIQELVELYLLFFSEIMYKYQFLEIYEKNWLFLSGTPQDLLSFGEVNLRKEYNLLWILIRQTLMKQIKT